MNREPGISFIMRVAKGDTAKVMESVASLSDLTIPHEIVVIGEQRMHRYAYEGEISRAGYETLITPASSPHSLPSFLRWCMERGKYRWSFRWDADFIASPQLIEFLNAASWSDETPTRIRFPQSSGNNEPVLFNAGHEYAKYIFWEYNKSIFEPHVREMILTTPILHASSMTEIKSYWRTEPWFCRRDIEEAAALRLKYETVVELLGPEPVGLARACNPACEHYEKTVRSFEGVLNSYGISLWN